MAQRLPDIGTQIDAMPLAGVRVVEILNGKTEMCARFLADMGAEVIIVEPPQGDKTRLQEPKAGNISYYFATHNANKHSVALNLEATNDRARFERLIGVSDIFIDTSKPGTMERLGLGADILKKRNPKLVVLSITDFGLTGPYRDYVATNSVHTAIGGVLCRSGLPDMPPLLPPGALACESAAIQAAWCALLAYWQSLQTGVGDHLDFSIHEGTAQVFDPGLGVTGSAAGGKSAQELAAARGRPPVNPLYPIFRVKDGYVRLCILNPRQWEGMSGWLGDKHEFTDPSYANLAKRVSVIARVNATIGELFKNESVADLVAEGQRRGVPISALSTPSMVLKDAHFLARGAFIPFEAAPGHTGMVPPGFVELNGNRAGIRNPAPHVGDYDEYVFGPTGLANQIAKPDPVDAPEGKLRYPLSGLRVLDLGIIVAGAELGRLFADQGAEVIKIENRAFPDGLRQSLTSNAPMTPSFAQGHRGKLSMGINLKSPKGRDIFKELVAKSDVILSNFKPGTLESLKLGYDELKQVNPRIIMVDSSALGRTGPLSRSLGYGPLVRMMSGLTSLWCYPGVDNSFSDCNTIYPDHIAARVAAVGALAILIKREKSKIGGEVSVSQAEIFLTQSSEYFLRESISPGSFNAIGNVSEFNAPDGVYPCTGDDEWCVVSVQNDEQWQSLAHVIGAADMASDSRFASASGRVKHREQIESVLTKWTSSRTPEDVMQILQSAGVPAGKMLRLSEYETNPHLQARGFFRTLIQPGVDTPLVTENAPVKARYIPEPDIRPAPYQGENTRELAARVLGYSAEQIEAFVSSGDLEVMALPK